MPALLQRLRNRLTARDHGLLVLRRAGRTAIVMPGTFALCDQVIGNPEMALFAAFGSFAMLMLVGFGGPMRQRMQAQASLAVVSSLFVCLGTLASQAAWLACLAMAVLGFGVLLAGAVSSVLAGASTSLLLSFILPVSLPGRPRMCRIGWLGGGWPRLSGCSRSGCCGPSPPPIRCGERQLAPVARWPPGCAPRTRHRPTTSRSCVTPTGRWTSCSVSS
ncbi:hypothetical protein ACFXOY_18950 [Streptomyces niveus]|uniref:hypothetical protein n=1 Tax=Streptomyces niveus TaxID=193462 RepID=UPI00367558C3